MSAQWKKLGLLYCPTEKNQHPKLISHAANPLPILIKDDTYRIYFSGRDANNRSSVGAVDIDIIQRKIVREYKEPFFEHGLAGSFYADGVSIGNCYEVYGTTYMLFMGWQSPRNDHWRGDIGRLIVKPDLSLELDTELPFIGIDPIDPISLSYPWVIKEKINSYTMWYGSTLSWRTDNGEMLHVLHHASSTDGHKWKRLGLAVPYELGSAQAFSRPVVLKKLHGEGYEMWFSYRSGSGTTYRIGYAISPNGQDWELALNKAGITLSKHGWDSEMIEYPFVLDHKGERYMLYNGNGYGKTGFGLAILTHE